MQHCKQALRRRKHWLLAQKISNCFDFTQAACASVQTTSYTVKQFAQSLCLRKLLARVGAALGPCQTSGLAAAVAKRPGRCETAFERGYIDSYVKR